uniref:hypothetical protein n=1 Tax=Algoriphagus sp. TaxID=1872435 RepID=UPI0025864F82|nr:hypothetical protein [Algoriphagus sp.]
MIAYTRSTIFKNYFSLEIEDCPIDVLLHAASLGANQVTVINFRLPRDPNSLSIQINSGDRMVHPTLRSLVANLELEKADFLALKAIWDVQGCYALFHEKTPIKIRVTDLMEGEKYRALDNFGWNLEIAMPDGTSGEWTQIVSPDSELIDQIERLIQGLG